MERELLVPFPVMPVEVLLPLDTIKAAINIGFPSKRMLSFDGLVAVSASPPCVGKVFGVFKQFRVFWHIRLKWHGLLLNLYAARGE